MRNARNFGELRTGAPFEIELSNIIDPLTGSAYTNLSGINFKFAVKEDLEDLDAAADAIVRESDTGFSHATGTATVRLVSNAISETLKPGRIYYFDGWLEDGNGIWREIDFGTDEEIYVGYFHTARAVSDVKD